MDERAQAALAEMIRAVVGRDLDELYARLDRLEQSGRSFSYAEHVEQRRRAVVALRADGLSIAAVARRLGLVFGNAVGEVENDALIRRRYRRALKAAGLPRVRFHDLRHAFGSTAVKAFPLSDVQAMLGHAHVTTTMRYVHHRPGAGDAQRLAAAFGGEAVPRAVPRNRGTGQNSEQLSDTETAP